MATHSSSGHVANVLKFNMEPETTNNKCPNKCGQLLVRWIEANGDDYRTVEYCNQCEERFDE